MHTYVCRRSGTYWGRLHESFKYCQIPAFARNRIEGTCLDWIVERFRMFWYRHEDANESVTIKVYYFLGWVLSIISCLIRFSRSHQNCSFIPAAIILLFSIYYSLRSLVNEFSSYSTFFFLHFTDLFWVQKNKVAP